MNLDLEIFGYMITIHPKPKTPKLFDVYIKEFQGEQKINAIKALREVYFRLRGDQMNLMDAKNFIIGIKKEPFILAISKDSADNVVRMLVNQGIESEIVDHKE